MKYKIIFSYDGTNFYGYAIQKNEENTVQAVLENAISTILNTKTKIAASGRTDKGVHALAQVATFDSVKAINLNKFKNSLNKMVSDDIYIKSITKVNDDFNARFSAKAKIYLYIINFKEYDPFKRNYEYFDSKFDIKKMKDCSKLFVGKHNFKNFTSKPKDDWNFERSIYAISFKETKDHLYIEFKGDGFMTYMVRKILGTMLEYSKDKITKDEIINYLTKDERDIITFTAESKGLYLKKVIY